MSRVDQTGVAGKIRDMPISPELEDILDRAAAAAGIDRVWVYSGGQPGSHGRRTGSTRHEHGRAADLQLFVGGAALKFTNASAPAPVRSFITECARLGATGIGAATDYMGPHGIHVGFGLTPEDHTRIVWGKEGRSANAPEWLRAAAGAGWNKAAPRPAPVVPQQERMLGLHEVTSRSGLNRRNGPGSEFDTNFVLPVGGVVNVIAYHEPQRVWALVDSIGDGSVDGYVFADFLRPLEAIDEEAA